MKGRLLYHHIMALSSSRDSLHSERILLSRYSRTQTNKYTRFSKMHEEELPCRTPNDL